MLKGYDFFTTMPDTVDEMVCKVCGEVCYVERSVSGPMSWAGAMAGSKTIHDEFSCSNGEDKWHEEALELVQEIQKCHSHSLKKIMNDDLKDMIQKGV